MAKALPGLLSLGRRQTLLVAPVGYSSLTALRSPTLPLLSSLVRCNLSGTIPAAWASPKGLQRLQSLQLARNRLSGTLPPHWVGALGQLQLLDVSLNALSGGLPASWESHSLSEMCACLPAGAGCCMSGGRRTVNAVALRPSARAIILLPNSLPPLPPRPLADGWTATASTERCQRSGRPG